MAQKKQTKSTATSRTRNAVRSPKDLKGSGSGSAASRQKETRTNGLARQIAPFLLLAVAVFLAICFIWTDGTGAVGRGLHWLLFGLLSGSAVALPLLLGVVAIFMIRDEDAPVSGKMIYAGLFLLFLSVLVHLLTNTAEVEAVGYNVKELFVLGGAWKGGGLIGGLIGRLLLSVIGRAGAYLVAVIGLLLFGLFLFGLTPRAVVIRVKYYLHEKKEAREAAAAARPRPQLITEEAYLYDDDDPSVSERIKRRDRAARAGLDVTEAGGRDKLGSDIEIDTDDPVIPAPNNEPVELDESVFDTVLKKQREDAARGVIDLDDIFTEPQSDGPLPVSDGGDDEDAELELEVERRALVEEEKKPEKPKPAPIYTFPPLSLLKIEYDQKNEDVSEELRTNATKLVETLRSFKVRTHVVNVSRGPTVTRYELAPEEGVRVRAITNLVDDIALNLATSGVRIEAPIPGKQAVGIEVPNRNTSTVYLRRLLDDDRFRSSPSKLTASLGEDVAGEPVYLDIAKMPHLLIAGATGSGKSVCINSMIMSLLYKATPDEVKLILIDPKKVELSIYNGLPHLLVPVVSEPKKAAGALAWAVTEMERRFELIEQCGVRNIKNYNLITKDDPEREFMSQLVIIIDELADLMMTAPDDVENSICRLAQKGRAAGIHLIVGTQRPSVDVVTGLIKANIPSRIAFAVSGITDSRVILDYAGAEKLIGRGDMLFAPIGELKPIRVQGSFVSENEVESVVEFIKKHIGEASEYDSAVLDTIEREAARCGQGKKSAGAMPLDDEGEDDGEGSDPMLKPAIELAVTNGKISTSLIQRKLSLGYGRAAKLIDRMETLGYVSAPDGQKPRTVLITKEEYMEKILRNDDLGEGGAE